MHPGDQPIQSEPLERDPAGALRALVRLLAHQAAREVSLLHPSYGDELRTRQGETGVRDD